MTLINCMECDAYANRSVTREVITWCGRGLTSRPTSHLTNHSRRLYKRKSVSHSAHLHALPLTLMSFNIPHIITMLVCMAFGIFSCFASGLASKLAIHFL